MTEILFAVSPSVFSWSMLGRGSSAAFLLPLPEKFVLWPTPCRTHPARVAVVALVVTGLVDICSECRTGGPREGTCHLPNVVNCTEVIFWSFVSMHWSNFWLTHQQLDQPETFSGNFRNWGEISLTAPLLLRACREPRIIYATTLNSAWNIYCAVSK